MKSHDVKIWNIKVNSYDATARTKRQRKSYTVRWIVAGQERSKTFGTRPLADNYRSDLKQATNRGEAFDVGTGLPESMTPTEIGPTWLEHVEKYVEMRWPDAAANTRKSMLEAIVAVTPVLVASVKDAPPGDVLRKALRNHLVPADRKSDDVEQLAAMGWLRSASVELKALEDSDLVRSALDAVAKKLDGTAAAATTRRRKRAVFFNVLEFAIELRHLTHNPIDRLRVRKRQKKVVETVDRRVVANPVQARELLVALTYVGGRDRFRGWKLRAFYGAIYYVGLRPGEAMGLREPDCHLPAHCSDCKADLTHDHANTPVNGCRHERIECGWGRYTLEKNRPQTGKLWTDSGENHDDRGLKHRAEGETRSVPVAPEQVALTREHIRMFGVAADGSLFRTKHGNPIGSTTYSRVWSLARQIALKPAQVLSVLAGTAYDLRHACLSLQLNAGVPATEVANRAGNSVEVLLKVYAKCIDGDEEIANRRIEKALRGEQL